MTFRRPWGGPDPNLVGFWGVNGSKVEKLKKMGFFGHKGGPLCPKIDIFFQVPKMAKKRFLHYSLTTYDVFWHFPAIRVGLGPILEKK